ncbi:MAG: hypothetical protein CMP12_10440 [Zunongwangia sp.]|uniref:hypothetical protein n=1 Tax=Zunongwangia profunda TaxID=398743 RepID=UPI000C94A290|nr:hypothetical protein [Zunongwangia profunda]MAG86276.1 hypothetical protein [Flavobacteriaceae bacterium]MAO36305.1 hypothetical protein [Zunongwangia sp.]MCC4227959.1 hypothetical protein [Zunongwangia profunda]
MKQKDSLKLTNKQVPDEIWREAYIALSHYPELKDTPITFKFKKNIKKSFMQAQPSFSGIFKNRKKRAYFIFINEEIKIEDEVFTVTSAPSEVIIGWIGHELGHVMDYRNRSGINLFWFGVRYLTSHNYIREAERAADTYAVNHGLGDYIIATKDFILNQSNLSENYKNRIKKLYLSQEEIVELVDDLEELREESREKDSY